MNKEKFYFEMTDTFGGELNYCWLRRFTIEAKNLRGALLKLSRETGYKFRNDGSGNYRARGACVAAYESYQWESPDEAWIEESVKL